MIPQKITALVPMKEHSSRVPNKNIRELAGKPACHWILESLSAVEEIDEILVNTDSKHIAELVEPFEKVKVLKRPDYLLGDSVSIQPLIEYDLKHAHNQHILQTHSTNPAIKPETFSKAIAEYFSNLDKHETLFSVTPIKQRFYFVDGRPVNHDPDHLIQTQLLEPILHENSCFYIFSKDNNKLRKNRLGKNPFMFYLDALEAADIDDWGDFLWAEFLLNRMNHE
jgi:N-acylneuraminate cytidylyltransferase